MLDLLLIYFPGIASGSVPGTPAPTPFSPSPSVSQHIQVLQNLLLLHILLVFLSISRYSSTYSYYTFSQCFSAYTGTPEPTPFLLLVFLSIYRYSRAYSYYNFQCFSAYTGSPEPTKFSPMFLTIYRYSRTYSYFSFQCFSAYTGTPEPTPFSPSIDSKHIIQVVLNLLLLHLFLVFLSIYRYSRTYYYTNSPSVSQYMQVVQNLLLLHILLVFLSICKQSRAYSFFTFSQCFSLQVGLGSPFCL